MTAVPGWLPVRWVAALVLLVSSVLVVPFAAPARATATSLTFAQVAAGRSHSCAVTDDGYVFCWGGNDRGQLGIGTVSTEPVSTPQVIAGLTGVRAIDAGGDTTCALTNDAVLWCWGANNVGQLGVGTTEDSATPLEVPLDSVVQVSVGARHVCALRAISTITWSNDPGRVYCWGGNGSGQLGYGDAEDLVLGDFPALAADVDNTVFTYDEGHDVFVGFDTRGRVGTTGANGLLFSMSQNPDLATGVGADGKAYLYSTDGGALYRQATDDPSHNTALRFDFSSFQRKIAVEPAPPVGQEPDIFSAVNGAQWSLQRLDGGDVAGTPLWDAPATNAAGDAVDTIVDLAVGHSPIFSKDVLYVAGAFPGSGGGSPEADEVQVFDAGSGSWMRTIQVSQSSGPCQRSGNTSVTAVSSNADGDLIVAYTQDPAHPLVCIATFDRFGGLVSVFGGPDGPDNQAPGPFGAIAGLPNGRIAVFDEGTHRLGLFDPDGSYVNSWGRTTFQSTPRLASGVHLDAVPFGTLLFFTQLSAGPSDTCATQGVLPYCWGSNGSGQARFGAAGPTSSWASSSATDYDHLAAGAFHTCGLVAGVPSCWGDTSSAQTDITPLESPAVAYADVEAGDLFGCFLSTTGQVRCIGADGWGQRGDATAAPPCAAQAAVVQTAACPASATGDALSGVESVATGSAHACAVDSAGDVWCWGRNSSHQVSPDAVSSLPYAVRVEFPGAPSVGAVFSGPSSASPTPPFTVTFDAEVAGVSSTSVTVRDVTAGVDLSAAGDIGKPECVSSAGTAVNCLGGPVVAVTLSAAAELDCQHVYEVSVNPGPADVRWGPYPLDPLTSPEYTVPCPKPLVTGPDASSPDTARLVPADGPVVVSFARPVSAVTAADVVLATAAGAPVAALRPKCQDAAGETVDCRTGAVRRVRLVPTTTLDCGADYVVGLNPSASADKVWWGAFVLPEVTASEPLTATCAVGAIDDATGGQLTYRWARTGHGRRGFVSEDQAGATATYSFSGSRVDWVTRMGPTQGKAKVWIDGESQGVVNNYARRVVRGQTWRYPGLVDGPHVLTIEVLGRKGSPRGRGTAVVVDAVNVQSASGWSRNGRPRGLVFGWGQRDSDLAIGGSYSLSRTAKASVSLTFTGTGVVWRTLTSPTGGTAVLTVDGVAYRTVSTRRRGEVRVKSVVISGFTDDVHVLSVTVAAGTKRRPAGAVAIDGFLGL